MGNLAYKRLGRQKKQTTHAVCSDCPAICCRNLSVRILKPTTKSEIEDLKWHLYYDTVKVYITSNRWHLLIKGKCIYLNRKNLCSIYDRRPAKCRRHNPPDCERFGEIYDVLISTPDELDEYLNGKKR
jgi:Fe-S-cluster containining protein